MQSRDFLKAFEKVVSSNGTDAQALTFCAQTLLLATNDSLAEYTRIIETNPGAKWLIDSAIESILDIQVSQAVPGQKAIPLTKLPSSVDEQVVLKQIDEQKIEAMFSTPPVTSTPLSTLHVLPVGDKSEAKQDELALFLNTIFNSSLDEKTKTDSLKVIHCFQYIHKNLVEIVDKVARKDDLRIYPNQRDFRHRVLRDDAHTSFHIGLFNSADEATHSLTNNITQLCSILRRLTDVQKIKFAEHLEYDREVGCLEARIARAQIWALRVLGDLPITLNEILEEATQIHDRNPAAGTLFEVAVAYANQEGWVIDIANLRKYIKDLGLEAEEQPSISPQPSVIAPTYLHTQAGRSGMMQYHFSDKQNAQQFLTQAKLHLSAKFPEVRKAKALQEVCALASTGSCHIVRLTPEQANHIRLQPKEQEQKRAPEVVPAPAIAAVFPKYIYLSPSGELSLLLHFIEKEEADHFLQQHNLSDVPCAHGTCLCHPSEKQAHHQLELHLDHLNKIGGYSLIAILTLLRGKIDVQGFNRIFETVKSIQNPFVRRLLNAVESNMCLSDLAARYQLPEDFKTYLAQLDVDACNRVALFTNKEKGSCVLIIVATYQSSENFIAFGKKLTPETLAKALFISNRVGHNILHTAASRQTPEAFHVLLQGLEAEKETREQFNVYLKQCKKNQFLELIREVSLYQSPANVHAFLQLFDTDNWLRLKKDAQPINGPISIRLMIRALIKKAPDLIAAHTRFTGHMQSYDQAHPATLPEDHSKVRTIFKQGKALVKMIRNDNKHLEEKNWLHFCAQLKDYTVRPDDLRVHKNRPTHKFVHIPQKRDAEVKEEVSSREIIPYRNKDEQAIHKRTKHYAYTKKNSQTQISSCLNTGLFGYHSTKQREMVGLVFNRDFVRVKAMLSQDRGTHAHGWVGDFLSVSEYANGIQTVSYTDENAFKEKIDRQPYVVNEVQAKVKLESVVAIVIGQDTLNARALATRRQAEFARLFSRRLPIVVYDPEKENIYRYDPPSKSNLI